VSKQPIIYSGVFDSGCPVYFAARIFNGDPCRDRIAGWHDDGTGSFESALSSYCGFSDMYFNNKDFADDGEAIAWLLDGEKGGALRRKGAAKARAVQSALSGHRGHRLDVDVDDGEAEAYRAAVRLGLLGNGFMDGGDLDDLGSGPEFGDGGICGDR